MNTSQETETAKNKRRRLSTSRHRPVKRRRESRKILFPPAEEEEEEESQEQRQDPEGEEKEQEANDQEDDRQEGDSERANDVVLRLKRETGQTLGLVYHALIAFSGDVEYARAFLLGKEGVGVHRWTPEEDAILMHREEGKQNKAEFEKIKKARGLWAVSRRIAFINELFA